MDACVDACVLFGAQHCEAKRGMFQEIPCLHSQTIYASVPAVQAVMGSFHRDGQTMWREFLVALEPFAGIIHHKGHGKTMKHIRSLLSTAVAMMVATTFADEATDPGSAVADKLQPALEIPLSISLRLGYHDFNKDTSLHIDENGNGSQFPDVDKSWCLQTELRYEIRDTPLDIVARGYYASTDFKIGAEQMLSAGGGNKVEVASTTEATQYGGSIQALWNFARGEALNPYVAAGAVFDKIELDATYRLYQRVGNTWKQSSGQNFSSDDDGTAAVVRGGLEYTVDSYYFRGEVGYLTKLYEDAMFELNGMAGYQLTEKLRLDLAATYFTKEYKDYFITFGVTYSL